MAETLEQRTATETSGNATSGSSGSRLKKLTSGSTWKSPFRSSAQKKNLHQNYKEQNAIDKIKVPRKFASHPTLDALKKEDKDGDDVPVDEETTDGKEGVQDASIDVTSKDASVKSIKGIPVTKTDESGDEVQSQTSQELKTDEEAALNASSEAEEVSKEKTAESDVPEELESQDKETTTANDDDIQQQVKEAPIELVTQPSAKYVPVDAPNKEVLESFKDKPSLLNRYQDLNTVAIGSVSKAQFDDPNKVIDLGAGHKMTQQQLLDIAAKRVAPVLSNINQEVEKTRNEDEIKHQKEIENKANSHQKKLQGDYEKHLKKISKQKLKFNKEIDGKIDDLTRLIKNAEVNAASFEKTTKEEIFNANSDFEEREKQAVENHGIDKETLINNHEELLSTKKQELEDSKTGQETAQKEIEDFNERKTKAGESKEELTKKVDELTSELNEKVSALDKLKEQHDEKKSLIATNLSTKEELNSKLDTAKSTLAEKKSSHKSLTAEVAVLATTLAAYTSKIKGLNEDKQLRNTRLSDAKNHYKDWEEERQTMAKEIAKDHERKRLEAQEAVETQRVQDKFEKQRLEKEAEIEKSQKEEQERLKSDPEHQRLLRVKQRELEQQKLQDQIDESNKIYNDRKKKEEQEALKLQKEVEELKAKQQAELSAGRQNAELVAQTKLQEIEKLKEEHASRLKLFEDRLKFEEMQKSRLLEEVENLKKIRELREEKARLSIETNKNTQLEDIQKLIEQRELEITRLSKQIELDDKDLNKVSGNKLFLDKSNDSLENSNERANSNKAKSLTSPVGFLGSLDVQSKSKSSKPANSTTNGIVTSEKSLNGDPKRSRSLSKSLKNLSKKIGGKSSAGGADDGLVESSANQNAPSRSNGKHKSDSKPVDISNQPAPLSKTKTNTGSMLSSEYETYSVYEEVSESVFEANKNDPNFIEMTHEEFAKHRTK